MTLLFRTIASPAALLALAACNAPISFTAATRATNGAAVVIGTDGDDTIVNGAPLTGTAVPTSFSISGFGTYTDTNDRFIFIGRSASGEVSAMVVGTDGVPMPMTLAAYGRASAGELPTSGSATMTGRYAGFVGLTTGTELENSLSFYATGDVALTANFASNAVSGAVTNRQLNGTTAAGDVTLTAAPIGSSGTYEGTATSAQLVPSVAGVSGSYQGLLAVGPGGPETAGAVKLLFNDGTNSYAELGAFYAD